MTSTGAAAALEGFNYQSDVSVYAALDLILARGLTRSIIIEPDGEDDLEAELAECEPARSATRASVSGYTLVLQAKHRSETTWTVGKLIELVKHGTRRAPARDRLKDSSVRYLLASDAAPAGEASGLAVTNIGAWPPTEKLPPSFKNALPADAGGRFAVLHLSAETLRLRILELIMVTCHVATTRREACLQALRQEALARMRAGQPMTWTYEALDELIRRFGGYLSASRELADFVKPTNWDAFKEKLDSLNAVIIAGHSGTGKTTAALRLAVELRDATPGMEIVEAQTPEEVLSPRPPGPVVFLIDDPWGKYKLGPSAAPWNDKVQTLLQQGASPGRAFIITSRSDILGDAHAIERTAKWGVALEAESYGPSERAELFESGLRQLQSTELKELALQWRAQALEQLLTPLEMRKFFDWLEAPRESESNAEHASRALSRTRADAIAADVAEQIRQRGETSWAAVLWSLLKLRRRQARDVLPDIQRLMGDIDRTLEDGLDPCINFLIAGRHLRQAGSVITYGHPRVEEGLELAMAETSGAARRAIKVLVEALLRFDRENVSDWGTEHAAQVLRSSLPDSRFRPSFDTATRATIDSWLEAKLASSETEFREVLGLAAEIGSPASVMSEVARWLLNSDKDEFITLGSWKAPAHDAAWYERIRADAHTHAICSQFVQNVLPRRSQFYPRDFADALDQLAPGLTPAFTAAALDAVEYGYFGNDDAIAYGALKDLDGFGRVADAALDFLKVVARSYESAEAAQLQLHNDEFSDDHADHLRENDDGHTAGEFLRAYVGALHKDRGWKAIATHRRASELSPYWIRVLARDGEPPVGDEEAKALIAAALRDSELNLWEFALSHWSEVWRVALERRLHEGSDDPDVRSALAACALMHAEPTIDAMLSDEILEPAWTLNLALDAQKAVWEHARRDSDLPQRLERTLNRALPPVAEIARAFSKPRSLTRTALSAATLDLLASLPDAISPELRLQSAWLLACNGRAPNGLDALLADPIPWDIQDGAFTTAIDAGLDDLVEAGLVHPLAEIRIAAMRYIAAKTGAPLPARVLALADDKGSMVRTILAELIAAQPHRGHLETLARLLADKWEKHSGQYGPSGIHPIARAAADAVAAIQTFENGDLSLLANAAIQNSDPVVADRVFSAFAANGGHRARERLMKYALAHPNRRGQSASVALMGQAEALEPNVVGLIEPARLTTLPFVQAACLTLIVGIAGDEPQFNACADALRNCAPRAAFLLLLGWGRVEREPASAIRIANLLPPQHTARTLLDGTASEPLPRTAVDDLGDVRAIRAVRALLGAAFEPEPERRNAWTGSKVN